MIAGRLLVLVWVLTAVPAVFGQSWSLNVDTTTLNKKDCTWTATWQAPGDPRGRGMAEGHLWSSGKSIAVSMADLPATGGRTMPINLKNSITRAKKFNSEYVQYEIGPKEKPISSWTAIAGPYTVEFLCTQFKRCTSAKTGYKSLCGGNERRSDLLQ
ncbi:hypothetical protein T439DRAFT_359984 [Meredithblackwellia eburnea MCA 4105]